MTGAATRVGAGIALDAMSGRATQTARTMYLALLTAAPGPTTTPATMTEVSTAGYARQAVTFNAPTAADPSVQTNSGALTFGPFTADPPNVPYLGLVSSSSGTSGQMTYQWTADVARDAALNDSIQVASGALSMSASTT
jgi:hypothetical protein